MKHTHSTRFCSVFSAVITVALFAVAARAGAPLKGVDVKLGKSLGGSPMYSARTDEDGKFTFPKLPPGVYSLYISYDEVSKFAIKEDGLPKKKIAIDEPGVQANKIAIGDPGVNGNLQTSDAVRTGEQKKWMPANFKLELADEKNVTVEVQGEPTAKRQHSAITITKEWGRTTSMVTITVAETATFVGKLSYNRD